MGTDHFSSKQACGWSQPDWQGGVPRGGGAQGPGWLWVPSPPEQPGLRLENELSTRLQLCVHALAWVARSHEQAVLTSSIYASKQGREGPFTRGWGRELPWRAAPTQQTVYF